MFQSRMENSEKCIILLPCFQFLFTSRTIYFIATSKNCSSLRDSFHFTRAVHTCWCVFKLRCHTSQVGSHVSVFTLYPNTALWFHYWAAGTSNTSTGMFQILFP